MTEILTIALGPQPAAVGAILDADALVRWLAQHGCVGSADGGTMVGSGPLDGLVVQVQDMEATILVSAQTTDDFAFETAKLLGECAMQFQLQLTQNDRAIDAAGVAVLASSAAIRLRLESARTEMRVVAEQAAAVRVETVNHLLRIGEEQKAFANAVSAGAQKMKEVLAKTSADPPDASASAFARFVRYGTISAIVGAACGVVLFAQGRVGEDPWLGPRLFICLVIVTLAIGWRRLSGDRRDYDQDKDPRPRRIPRDKSEPMEINEAPRVTRTDVIEREGFLAVGTVFFVGTMTVVIGNPLEINLNDGFLTAWASWSTAWLTARTLRLGCTRELVQMGLGSRTGGRPLRPRHRDQRPVVLGKAPRPTVSPRRCPCRDDCLRAGGRSDRVPGPHAD